MKSARDLLRCVIATTGIAIVEGLNARTASAWRRRRGGAGGAAVCARTPPGLPTCARAHNRTAPSGLATFAQWSTLKQLALVPTHVPTMFFFKFSGLLWRARLRSFFERLSWGGIDDRFAKKKSLVPVLHTVTILTYSAHARINATLSKPNRLLFNLLSTISS